MSSSARKPHIDLEEEYPLGAELVLHPMRPRPTTYSVQDTWLGPQADHRYSNKIRKLGFFKAAKARYGKDIFTEPWPEEESYLLEPTQIEPTVRIATFVQRLRVNEWKPSQLMLISLRDMMGPSPLATRCYIAMIYDPAVFCCNQPHLEVHPVKKMQAYFSQDIHARVSLGPAICLPEFRGSFWAEWSARRVGVILLEDVGIGRTALFLNQIQPLDGTVDKDRRKRIVANIFKADFEAWSGGVEYRIWAPSNLLLRMSDDRIFLIDLARSFSSTPKVPTLQEMFEKWSDSFWHYELTCSRWIPLPLTPHRSVTPDKNFLMDCLKLGLGASEESEVLGAKRPATEGIWSCEVPSGNNRYNLRPRK